MSEGKLANAGKHLVKILTRLAASEKVSLSWHSAYKRAQNLHHMFSGVNLLTLIPCLQKLAEAVSIAPREVKSS